MATESGGNRADEVKTQFTVREGTYRLSNLSEYSRPNRTNYVEGGTSPVFLSFTSLHSNLEIPERVCFNVGKELFVYPFKGLKKVFICLFKLCFAVVIEQIMPGLKRCQFQNCTANVALTEDIYAVT